MSYGWLTESTILPRKGTEINVPSSSLQALNAAIYDVEDNISKGKKKQKKTAFHTLKLKSGKKDWIFQDISNEGVDVRRKKDELLFRERRKSHSNIHRKLEEKSELYDLLEILTAVSSSCDSKQKLAEEKGFLIDFKSKKEEELGRNAEYVKRNEAFSYTPSKSRSTAGEELAELFGSLRERSNASIVKVDSQEESRDKQYLTKDNLVYLENLPEISPSMSSDAPEVYDERRQSLRASLRKRLLELRARERRHQRFGHKT